MNHIGPYRIPSGWRLPAKAVALASLISLARLILDLAGAEGISVSPLVATPALKNWIYRRRTPGTRPAG